MNIVFRRGRPAQRPAGALVVGVLEGERKPSGAVAAIDRAARGAVSALLARRDFSGAPAEIAVLYPGNLPAKRLLVAGLGPRAELTTHRVRLAAAAAARKARDLRARTVIMTPLGAERLDPAAAAQAVAEGAALGPWRFGAYRTKASPPALTRVEIVDAEPARAAAMAEAVERGARWAEGTLLARDLAWTPGADLTPERLAARAAEVARASGARIEVLDVPAMERLGMNGVLGVGRGSANPPRFVVLERARRGRGHRGAERRGRAEAPAVVLVGKGVTFDTGGISLKPRENLHEMKYDMSGAAAVLGVFSALAGAAPSMRLVGLLPAAENMPGGRALKPGDVLRMLDGTTVEITNTDAEGRLLLADALAYAKRWEGATVIDIATLTGAIGIALGHAAAGLFTADEALAGELLAAGEAAGERLWRMPLWKDYERDLESDTADVVNAGPREGGACSAARFL